MTLCPVQHSFRAGAELAGDKDTEIPDATGYGSNLYDLGRHLIRAAYYRHLRVSAFAD